MLDDLLAEAVERALRETCTFEAVQRAEADGWAPEIWSVLEEMGLPGISVPEAAGGSGGTVGTALAVLKLAGEHAAPVPLAETGCLAGWLLATAGLPFAAGPLTVVSPRSSALRLDGGAVVGVARLVPWARVAERIVAIVDAGDGSVVVSVPRDAVTIEPAVNLAGEPRDTVTFDHVVAGEQAPAPGDDLRRELVLRGALTRVMLVAGACKRISELVVQYTDDRKQFGVPVSKFQAVQAHLVRCAQDAAIVGMAADRAARAFDTGPAHFEVAAAKVIADQAATSATRAAHQAHGAIGMTREYSLHHFSRRCWAWRSEFGGERVWARSLGRALADAGADRLYPTITAGSSAMPGALEVPTGR